MPLRLNVRLAMLALLTALLGAALFLGCVRVGTAHADDPPVASVMDAGAGPLIDAGPYRTPAAFESGGSLTPPAVAPVLTDPVDNPGGYARDAVDAFRAGQWAFLVVLLLFGLARLLLFVASKWSIDWLKKATPSLVALSVALASVGASLAAGGAIDWRAMLGALAMVVALYLSPTPQPKEAG
jgi:hypothetical protein